MTTHIHTQYVCMYLSIQVLLFCFSPFQYDFFLSNVKLSHSKKELIADHVKKISEKSFASHNGWQFFFCCCCCCIFILPMSAKNYHSASPVPLWNTESFPFRFMMPSFSWNFHLFLFRWIWRKKKKFF